jgi:hypothetical protein
MSDAPKALIANLTEPAQWLRIQEKCRQFDTEEDSSDEYVYDVREDFIYYWGRDGWNGGFWHAKFYPVQEDGYQRLMAEQNEDSRAASVLNIVKLIKPFIADCLTAREVPNIED